MATQVQRGDPITAEWANSLFNPLNSYVGEGYVDKDRIVVVPGSGESNDIRFAKLDADLNAGSYCTASIWSGDTLADTGENKTVYDWFLETGKKLATGSKVMLVTISGKLYVTMSDTCPEDQ